MVVSCLQTGGIASLLSAQNNLVLVTRQAGKLPRRNFLKFEKRTLIPQHISVFSHV